jgi:site-specific DNA recombinase
MSISMETNTAAIYLRKSTEDDGKSVAQQERDIRSRAGQLGIEVIAVYREDDGTSASSVTNHNRPQFERCLADFKAGEFDTIMVWDMDRWTRKGATEAGQLLDLLSKHNGRLVDMSMDTLATGLENARIPLLMKAEIARTETVNMQKRVLRAKEQHRREGKHLGGSPPYGLVAVRSFDAPTYLVVDPEAVANINMMAKWIIEGCSTTEVAHKLNELGLTTSRNAAWTKTTVRRVLRSPHMIGQRLYRNIDPTTKKVISEDVARDEDGNPLIVTEPLLDEATFARVDAILSERKRENRTQNKGNAGGTKKSLLAGLTRCSKCLGTCQRVGGVRGGYYSCTGCRLRNSSKVETMEDYVSFYALSKLAMLEDGDPILDEVGRRWSTQFSAGDVSRRNTLQEEATKIESRLDKLRQAFYVADTITEDKFQDMEMDLMTKLAPIEAELATIPETHNDINHLFDLLGHSETPEDGLTGEGSAWAQLDHHVRRSILRCIIDTVVIEPGEKGKPGENIPQRCTITLATPDNVSELANRGDRPKGKHLNMKAKVLASNS